MKARPRVAFVCQPTTPVVPVRDSVTGVTKQLASRIGEHADVFVLGAGGRKRARSFSVEGMAHILVPTGPDLLLHRAAGAVRSRWRRRQADPKRPFFESPVYFLPFAVRAALQTRRLRCDIVHVQSFSHFVPVIRLLNRRARIVLHMHCEWLSQLAPDLIAPRLRKVDLVITCSEHVTRRVRAAFPGLVPCVTVHNGVEGVPGEQEGAATGRESRILFVSRVSPEKGAHVLIDALPQILAACPEARLDLVGPEHTIPSAYIVDLADEPEVAGLGSFYERSGASYGEELRRRISPEHRERVSFHGFLEPEHLADTYRSSAVLVQPSLSDSFGMPVAEAMAAGVPVVASRVGGLAEIVVDGITGLLVPPNDPAALADAVTTILRNSDLAAGMGQRGAQRVKDHFTWDRAAASLWSEYTRLLAPVEAST